MATKIEIALITVILGSGGVLAGAAIIDSPTPFKTFGQVTVTGFCLYILWLILVRVFSNELTPEIWDVERQKPVSRKEKKELIAKADLRLNMYNTISESPNIVPLTNEQSAIFKKLCNSIMRLKQKKAEGTYEQIGEATISLLLEMKKNSEHPQLQDIILFEKDGHFSFHEERRVIRNAKNVLDCLGDVMHQPFMDCMVSVHES